MVPPATPQDHDGRASQALPMARGSRGQAGLEQPIVADAGGSHGQAKRRAHPASEIPDRIEEQGALDQGETGAVGCGKEVLVG